MERLEKIRQAEALSHTEAYAANELFSPGSWLAKPVKTVLELLPLFVGYDCFRALDLGCGVGRNCIPVARYFGHVPCRIDCVDILELAIRKLEENALRYGVAGAIRGILSPIDDYEIAVDSCDLIMAVSALEHVGSKAIFEEKLTNIREGLRSGGIACLIVNSNVRERDIVTGEELPPQFETVLMTEELMHMLQHTFSGKKVIKHTVVRQSYDVPREGGLAHIETDVVTYVVRRG